MAELQVIQEGAQALAAPGSASLQMRCRRRRADSANNKQEGG